MPVITSRVITAQSYSMADGQQCRSTDGILASYTKHLGLQVRVTTVATMTGYAAE